MTIQTNRQHPQSGSTRTLPFRLLATLLASSIALAANMALLSIAGAALINTGQGGLLRLFAMMIQRLDGLSNLHLPSRAIFHIVTGLVMAVVYALMIEPRLPGRPFSKGLVYGAVVWCFNAFLVLPLIGEGIAGSRNVNTVGLIVFAVAHMTFFLALSMLYGALWSRRGN